MKYDTAGNIIYEPIFTCNCGSTSGCEKCRVLAWKERFNKDLEERACKFERVICDKCGNPHWKAPSK